MMAALVVAGAANVAGMALVTQDQTVLRAAASEAAPQQAQLWQGDVLEVRGQRLDHLQVWDHRRERAGYVRASQVKAVGLQAQDAPQLLAVLRFLRDQPGMEALGIAYAAAYLRAAPGGSIDAEPFDALGTMAERLARRASQRAAPAATSAHLEVAAQYGVRFNNLEREATVQLCYDGEAFQQVLKLRATPEQQARAVLALTRHDCLPDTLSPAEHQQADVARAQLLDRISGGDLAALPATVQNRLHLRRACVWSALAFARARAGHDALGTLAAGERAVNELAAVDKTQLADEDQVEWNEAALRVGASRWAAEAAVVRKAGLRVELKAGEAGQTCVRLLGDAAAAPLAQRCTYGVVWAASAQAEPSGRALALAVQTLEGWRELWLFRRQEQGWALDVLPPAAMEPGLGTLEFAGWVSGAGKLLLSREARVEGRYRRSFEVVLLDTLAVDKRASDPALLVLFGKWQDPAWKRTTVSLR
jgi:hypothetical protein